MVASVLLFIASLLLSLLLTKVIKQQFRQNFLDIPNSRSSHTQPTPRGGGLGFIAAFAFATLVALSFSNYFPQTTPNIIILWLILTPLTLIGILDDHQSVPASIRYLVQLSVAGLAVIYFGSFPLPWLHNFGMMGLIIAFILTVIGMTAMINFYNFMDGLDGLVAGVTALQLSFLALYLNQPIFLFLVAGLLGFLWWNWSPAKIFMGDAGSTILGASVAIALLHNTNHLSQV